MFWPTVVGLGLAIGFLSGVFGVGGGFLISPLLMFIGIPTEIAVATGANQTAATSASAAAAQWKRGQVDLTMAALLLSGGALGSVSGVFLVAALRAIGQIEFVISICYAFLLGALGMLMCIEGFTAMQRARGRARTGKPRSRSHHTWIHNLPLKVRFRRSKLYMSVIPPFVLGCFVGILGAIMGVGGGFVLVPAMAYLLKMPTSVVIGTSLVQVFVISSITTVLHAQQNQTVDVELAVLLIIGGVIGAQWGSAAGARMPSEQLRALLGLLVLAVGVRFALALALEPSEAYGVIGLRAP